MQLLPGCARDTFDQLENVRAQERLTAGEIDASSPQRGGFVDERQQPVPRHALVTFGTRHHEAVLAGEVAGVVDMDPELSETGAQGAGAAGVGGRRKRLARREAVTLGGPDEAIDVQAAFALSTPSSRA